MEIRSGDASRSPLAERVKFRKGHVPAYMISRAFIPPWSLVMRDRKLLDQTLPTKEAGTLVSPSRLFSRSRGGKVKNIVRPAVKDGSVVMELLQSVPSHQVSWRSPAAMDGQGICLGKKAVTRVSREAHLVSRKQRKGLRPALHASRDTSDAYDIAKAM